ncbi:MAG TPA: family 78 glycoside hydrolase catalytic domain [Verrucomicrobiae bacterium]|jgi:alpha-L-rhamnosidase|nr:family 78 glycoside hydrolase catalytic domain [Verrucomicrobiae bacterium]
MIGINSTLIAPLKLIRLAGVALTLLTLVEVRAAAQTSTVFGFETPNIGAGYQYNPTGGPWTFGGTSPSGSGIVVNGSLFYNPTAPEGVQAAFIQEYGTVSRSLPGFLPGTNYTVTFSAAERPNNRESWNVKIDNTVIGSYNPSSSATSYTDYVATFTATAATHKLSFVGTDLAGGDNTIFIDNIRISPALLSPPVVMTNTLPATVVDVVGSQITFQAGFSSLIPIAYQWQRISWGVTNNIAAATGTTLTLTNLQASDSASYQLRATNIYGVVASSPTPLVVNNVPGAVNNVIAEFATQTALGNASTNFAPAWTVAPGSLIDGQLPSNTGPGNFSLYGAGGIAVLTDGSCGSFNYWPGVGSSKTEVMGGNATGGAGQSVTYTLTGWPDGYSLTNITIYGGWGDAGRDSQDYTVYYSKVSAPSTFIPLSTVNYNPANSAGVQSATRATLIPASGFLATNVAAIKIDFTTPTPENDSCGYSEIQVFGRRTGALPIVGMPTCSPGSTVAAGTIATFSVSATGTEPNQYQWQTDNGNGGVSYTDIAGATGTNYVLDTANFGDFTINFRVRVTNPIGSTAGPSLQFVVTNADSSLASGTIGNLRCEHLQNPLGIDVTMPRLSWMMNSTNRGARQTAYQILVTSSPALLAQDTGDLWNSGVIVSDQSVLVPYGGQTLISGEVCYWKVRVWNENGNYSAWSPAATWSMGLLNSMDWTAQWIGMNENTNISPAPPSPMLRKTFSINKSVARATAYICGLGYYELALNGAKVGDQVLDPAWTRYDYHAYYATYDVTTNLVQGENAIGVQLANGFYNQWTGDVWSTANAPWRALPQMILQLAVQYSDGTSNLVVSDPSWKVSTGPLVLDQTRLGEVYDARLEQPGWPTAGFNDSTWSNAIAREGIVGSLLAPNAEPVKVFQTVLPVSIIPVSGHPGVYTFDFGQNLAGWGKLTVSGPAGTSVSMVYGELTNSDNSVNQDNINGGVTLTQYFQKDTYILKGVGTETYAPRFTYHGFRYVQISGLPSAPTTNTLVAQVVHTAFEPAGSFRCASELLNRIETNTLWSYLNNFVGIPTDCPTREKQGWDGDAQLACEVGLTHFHSAAAYTRWLKEFGPGQLANGELSGVYPNAAYGYGAGPAWEGAMVLIPWFVYQHSGDAGILTNNYAAMKAWVDYETSQASGNIVSYGLGDWYPANTATPAAVTDTGYYYEAALILAHTAALMGNTADSIQYSNLAAQIGNSFNGTFYNSTTAQYSIGSETAQSCALYQGLVNSNQIPAAAQALAAIVGQKIDTMDVGVLGSKYLLRALCDNGHSDVAMSLALQTNYPSWGYQVLQGATTLWETWNGATVLSLNHIMFGDISAWFMEYLAGISPGSPGYKSVIIKPEITGAVAWAQATHESPYGTISNAWQMNGPTITMDLVIPPNSMGVVYLPTLGTPATNLVIQESGVNIWVNGATTGSDVGVAYNHSEGAGSQTYSVWTVASGSYHFVWTTSVLSRIGWLPGMQELSISGTGQPGRAYVLLSATNLIPPIVWNPVMTNTADSSGNISFTNRPSPGVAAFYRISGN